MATTFEWSFPQFDAAPTQDGLSDVVLTVHWRLMASDGINTTDAYGSVQIPPPDPASFVSYQNITKEMAISWVVGAIDYPALQATLETNLANMLAPPVVPLPPPFS